MSAPLNLSVVVPLYNEEESLPHLVEQLLSALRPTDETFEPVSYTHLTLPTKA